MNALPGPIDDAALYRQVGSRLRQQRCRLGLTQTQVAAATGLLRTSVTNIEAGRQKAPLQVLYVLCAALRVEPASVLPSLATVAAPNAPAAVPRRLDGAVRTVPPMAAAFLDELLREEAVRDDAAREARTGRPAGRGADH